MKIVFENAEKELFQAITSIHKDQTSWSGWYCLHIKMPKVAAHKAMVQVQSNVAHAISNMMSGHKGNIYVCCYSEIYVFASGVGKEFLEDLAETVSSLVQDMTGTSCVHIVWDLALDGHRFIQVEADLTQEVNMPHEPLLVQDKDDAGATLKKVPHVLLVEDDPVTRWLVRNALKGRCVLTTASTAGVAIDSYQKHPSDVVFLDIGLPDKNGKSVLQHIMQHDPKACVVIFSGQSDMDNIVSLLENGATGFVSKPFTQEKLLHYISECPMVR